MCPLGQPEKSHVLKRSLLGEIITNVFALAWHCDVTHATGVSILFIVSTSPLLKILLFSCLLVLCCTRKLWTQRAEAAAAAGPRLMVVQLFSVMEVLLKWLLVGGVLAQHDLPQLDFHWTHFLCSAAWACVNDHIQYEWLSESCWCFLGFFWKHFSSGFQCTSALQKQTMIATASPCKMTTNPENCPNLKLYYALHDERGEPYSFRPNAACVESGMG